MSANDSQKTKNRPNAERRAAAGGGQPAGGSAPSIAGERAAHPRYPTDLMSHPDCQKPPVLPVDPTPHTQEFQR
ncbi:MAG: hypothetical protein MUC60_15490 [Oscillatoria sp. Prado101]|nr:hypothetical protein [Oscillatoria sp. Prado101]